MEKRRDYESAIELIELLLAQMLFGYDHRGALWERLALDQERYMKDYKSVCIVFLYQLVLPLTFRITVFVFS